MNTIMAEVKKKRVQKRAVETRGTAADDVDDDDDERGQAVSRKTGVWLVIAFTLSNQAIVASLVIST